MNKLKSFLLKNEKAFLSLGAISLIFFFYLVYHNFFGLILALLFLIFYLKPNWSLYFLLAFIPFKYFLKSLVFLPADLLTFTIPIVLLAAFLGHLWQKKFELKLGTVDKYLSWIFLASLVPTLFSGLTYGFRIGQLLDFFVWLQLIGFYLLGKSLFMADSLKKFLMANLIIANFVALFSLVQFKFLSGTPNWVETYESITARAFGPLGNPNALSGYLLMAILFFLFYKTKEQSQIKLKNLLLIILPSIAIYFTFSRSVWLVVVILVFLGLAYFKKWRLLAIACFIFLVAFALSPEGVKGRVLNVVRSDHLSFSSDTGRLWSVRNVFYINRSHFLFGSGWGSYGGEYAYRYNSPTYLEGVQGGRTGIANTDNQWLQVYAQQGIIGLWLYFLLFIYLFYNFLKKEEVSWGIFAYLFLGFFIDIFQFYQISFLPWLMIGWLSEREFKNN